jgi:ABC-2 type transport system ATP-binding protein
MIVDHGRAVIFGSPRDLKHRVAGDAVVITLKDDVESVGRSISLLEREPYVREISASGDQVRLYVEDGSAALPELLRILDHERIGVRSMNLSEPTLDDVFLRQTGRSLRDTEFSAGAAEGSEAAA